MQVKHYSSGMYVRLGFAVAINVEPDVLLVDEVLSVGDEAFQRKCLDRVRTFQREGRTILLVTHAADTVRQIAHRAAVLDHGRMVEVGEVGDAIRTFRETLNRDHEVHGEVKPPRTAIDPVTGELPVVVAPVELVPDAGAEVTISSVDIEYPTGLDALLPGGPLIIRIGYHATGMITDVVFAIEIFDDDGTRPARHHDRRARAADPRGGGRRARAVPRSSRCRCSTARST